MRGKYSAKHSLVLYVASGPHLSAIFYIVHKGLWSFNCFIVLMCASDWKNMAFLLTDHSKIDVESILDCFSLFMVHFVAFLASIATLC